MIIDTTKIKNINSFYRLESLKEIYGAIWILFPIFILVLGITIGVLVIVWLEREISAGIQQRIGPEYAGPLGILQALADGTKLLFKENLLPSRGDTPDLSIGFFYGSLFQVLLQLDFLCQDDGSNNKYSFLGGLRAAAQSISYEIPLTLCVLSISLRVNSSSTVDIVEAQSKYGIWGWNLLPFDLPEAEEELVAGYQTEYSVLYLGGWNFSIPDIFISEFFEIKKAEGVFGTTFDICITLAKTFLFLFIPIATRWTLPRLRMDQLLNLGWKFLLPIALGNLLLTTSSQLLSL
ncbi:hypothetical protein RND81_O347600 [Saponaria officinalis]|uniref:NADH-plastoquinone oxidoreductase subunit 1 n=1 Tax=Saponaria officinalis TaxID=3572 RepID=A0AAW1GMU4_SAPOF